MIDKSVMVLKSHDDKKAGLASICRKLAIERSYIGPFVKRTKKESVEA